MNMLAACITLCCLFANPIEAVLNPVRARSSGTTSTATSSRTMTRTSSSSKTGQEWIPRRRRLADGVTAIPPEIPPTRTCGQDVTLATVDQINAMASAFVGLFLPASSAALALSAIQSIVQYDVQATVVCASCDEIMMQYDGSNRIDNSSKFGFPSYCGSGTFAANITYSGLALTPYDPSTGAPIVGTLKSHLFTTSYTGDEQNTASEFWLSNFSIFETADAATTNTLFASFYDGWAPLLMASTGVVIVIPDYLGKGQSYQTTRGSGILRLYQQAAAVTFLKSKSMIESSGCTIIGSQTSASGYSEGGVGAFVGALALEGLGQEIVNVDTGGAPFRPSYQYAYSIDQIDNGTNLIYLKTQFAIGTTFFSSKIPDLPNTNMGQNMLNDQWRDLLVALADTTTSVEFLNTTLPDPVTDILTTSFLNKARVRQT
jgi:hypothetical protein